ncbi:MAG: sulfatase-like hydrolase/transferase [Verrucomicrobiota bacterium]
MIRKSIFYFALLFFACTAWTGERPNIVFIMSDDQGWGDVGYHDPALYTPHIDRLSAEGIRLQQHYVHPQCTPTRVALLTGRYPSRFGPHATYAGGNDQSIPYETPTLASLLKSAGYETALIGKWHLGSVPSQGPQHWGFDYSYGCLAGGCDNYTHLYKKAANNPYAHTWHRNGELIPDSEHGELHEAGKHTTDLLTQDAMRFIHQEREKPFFLYLAHTAPHTPLQEEEKWFNDPEGKLAKLDPERRLFAAVLHHLDDGIGQVAQALKDSGQWENTLVIFSSDNGSVEGSNGPLRSKKTHVYEGGIRVPAWVSWPARLEPGSIDHPMHVTDWLPTLCRLAGLETLPENLDGTDMFPLFQGRAVSRDFYWTWGVRMFPQPRRAVRIGDWKLVQESSGNQEGEWELFDLSKDPNETSNLAGQHPERVESLRAFLDQQQQLDAKAPMPSFWIDVPNTAEAGKPILGRLNCSRKMALAAPMLNIEGAELVSFGEVESSELRGVVSSASFELNPTTGLVRVSVIAGDTHPGSMPFQIQIR